MKIYACYSQSHRPLLERHFLPSIPVSCDVVLRRLEQCCPSAVYKEAGWMSAMEQKAFFIKDAMFDGHDPIIYSDVDVRFYGDFIPDLVGWLGDADLACQDDGAELCAGFFVVRPGRYTYRLFQRTHELTPQYGCDQRALNAAIVEIGSRIQVAKLPARYWTHGRTDGVWDGAAEVAPPADILIHHANYCVGVGRKMALLDAVERKLGSRGSL